MLLDFRFKEVRNARIIWRAVARRLSRWYVEETVGVVAADRPIDLSPMSFLPVTAVASITHRIAGAMLFVGAGYLIYLLDLALESETGFAEARALLEALPGKVALWAVLVALSYHLLAGIKHLLLDFHVGDSLAGGRRGSWLVLVLSALAAIGLGVWLW